MALLLQLSRSIDRLTLALGKIIGWLILAAVLVSAGNATMRKLFSISSNAWLEAQWYLFGLTYLVASAYTLQRNEHVRIDILSNRLPAKVRNWIDLFGHVFMLLPISLIMIWEMTPSMLRSFKLGETSANFGGLLIWPAKSFIVIGFALLTLQAVSEIIKRIAVMRRLIPDPHRTVSHTGPALEGGA